jgi:outer membrane protein TolC
MSAQAAVKTALRASSRVLAAEIRLKEAQTLQSSPRLLPPTSLQAGWGTSQVPGSTDRDLALIQPLDLAGRSRAATRVQGTRVQLARAELRLAQLEVQSDCLHHYNAVQAANQRLRAAESLLRAADQMAAAAKRKVDLGEVAEVYALRASLERERASQVLALRASELRASQIRLSGILGEEGMAVPPEFFTHRLTEPRPLTETLPALLILAAEAEGVEAMVREQRLANAPDASIELRRSPWAESAQAGLRFQVSLPLFDSGQNRRQVKAMGLRREALAKDLADALRRAEAELRAVESEVTATEEQVSRELRILDDARALTAIARRGFETGSLTLIETIEANRTLREAEEMLIEAQFRLAESQAAWCAATGTLVGEI